MPSALSVTDTPDELASQTASRRGRARARFVSNQNLTVRLSEEDQMFVRAEALKQRLPRGHLVASFVRDQRCKFDLPRIVRDLLEAELERTGVSLRELVRDLLAEHVRALPSPQHRNASPGGSTNAQPA